MRILLHPGFHKTGTSSVQQFLWVNRDILAQNGIEIRLLRHLRPAARIAMRACRHPMALLDLPDALDACLGGLDAPMAILSCEGLAGHMPGFKSLTSYATAPATIALIDSWLRDRLGADTQIVLTLRPRDPWLSSAWRHHLRGQRLCETESEFRHRLRDGADLKSAADAIDAALPNPAQRLGWRKLTTHRFGPGGAVLEQLTALPPGLRLPTAPANRGPDAALAQRFLDLNRSDLDDATVIAQKDHLAARAGLNGWVRIKEHP